MTEKIQGALFEKLKTAIENAEWNPKERSLTYEISKVLDEAKADAPQYRLVRTGPITPHIGSIAISPTVNDWNEWFKKWFGDAK